MAEPRVKHTATLLADGKALITGGASGRALLASAELYDPSTRNFVATGSMHWARVGFTATLPRNGKVLIAGGYVEHHKRSASAELYDPAKGTFVTTGTMVSPRATHSATLLPNGKVLIVGGIQNDFLAGFCQNPIWLVQKCTIPTLADSPLRVRSQPHNNGSHAPRS